MLCGPGAIELDDGGPVERFLATMEHVLEDRRVLWWVTAELGHEGPAYGRPAPAKSEKRAQRTVKKHDVIELDVALCEAPVVAAPPQSVLPDRDIEAALGRAWAAPVGKQMLI